GAGFTGSDDGAIELRPALEVAGVTREELFRRRSPNVPITQHDLRATGITYLAMRGESDDGIRERAGHTDFKMTQVYIRRGRRLVGAELGEPFAALPESLLKDDGRMRRPKPVSPRGDGVSSSVTSTGKSEAQGTRLDSLGRPSGREDSNLSKGPPDTSFQALRPVSPASKSREN